MDYTLPTVDLCGKKVSRLICGGNPLSGYSHVSSQLDREMIEYYNMPNLQKYNNQVAENASYVREILQGKKA